MADRNLILTLAKVVIAAAWADGVLSNEEINIVKDLVFRLTQNGKRLDLQLTGREWQLLDMYFDAPIDAAERSRLIDELQAELRTPRDRELAVRTLQQIIAADGDITDDERAVVDEIRSTLNAVDLDLFSQVGRLLTSPKVRRSRELQNTPNRESYFEDFISNRVYYALKQRHQAGASPLQVPEPQLRKLSLAGALLARVAHIDQSVTDTERAAIITALQACWGISEDAAAFVAAVALDQLSRDLDFYRLTRTFVDTTTEDERSRFLDALLAVADADGHISFDENEDLIAIARALLLPASALSDARRRFKQQS
jgi:uncharacterized tellurite resistance protein B-like protein